MKALFLGSIGTLSDTSELQREAFNAAFREHGLDWHWDRDAYRDMLRVAGGRRRIEAQAEAEGVEVDATAVHATKSRLFQEMLDAGRAEARPGIRELIETARDDGMLLGLVTTTSKGNVNALLGGLDLSPDSFDVVVTRDNVTEPKPDPECYAHAAGALGAETKACIAIEDNADGVRAALAAGTTCYAWPNENTTDHDFSGATMAGRDICRTIFGARAA
ncbi:HAD family hydrolase [Jannaschia ovalis]|uniref:HAD-IA family hydrolase n=1 Tax=Jannaschia ovalis TaxID=3038773 RepID=A0ABY8LGD1_9RHOB|nr:HAD-IA family hydrolase [Jannaschia sp. GRR-S6-38]WGH79410.1 HAD-IA family hydrolase [Jannaschia sp. GRR-S6-38]